MRFEKARVQSLTPALRPLLPLSNDYTALNTVNHCEWWYQICKLWGQAETMHIKIILEIEKPFVKMNSNNNCCYSISVPNICRKC